MQNEIFGIMLDDQGRVRLMQLFKKVRIIFIGSIIWSALNVLSLIAQLVTIKPMLRYTGRNLTQITIVYLLWICTIILLPLQGYFYYVFSKQMKLSIEEQNSERFNSGFRLLSTNASLVLIALLVSFLSVFYNISSFFWR